MSKQGIEVAADKGAGHARLFVGRPLTAPVQVAVQRGDRDNKTFLGKAAVSGVGRDQAWQDYVSYFDVALEAGPDGTGGSLLLGPHICNHIAPDLDVQFLVRDVSGAEIRTDYEFWPEVRISGKGGQSTIVVPPRPVEEVPQKPERQSPISPVGTDDDETGEETGDGPNEGKDGKEGVEPIINGSEETNSGNSRFWNWGGVAACIVLFIALGAATYAFQDELLCLTGLKACPGTETVTGTGDDQRQDNGTGSPREPVIVTTASGWDELISGGPDGWQALYSDPQADPVKVHRLATTLMETPDNPERFNHGVEALWAAAQKSHTPALLEVGALYDPTRDNGEAHGDISKKPDIAMDFYQRAKRKGSPEAPPAIARLCGWLSENRFTGDGSANRIFSEHCGD